MSEEAAAAAGDSAYWRDRALMAEKRMEELSRHAADLANKQTTPPIVMAGVSPALWERAVTAEADAAALALILSTLIGRGFGHLLLPDDADAVQRVLTKHPGAALLAELHAARELVTVLRTWQTGPTTGGELSAALEAYDQAVKVREL